MTHLVHGFLLMGHITHILKNGGQNYICLISNVEGQWTD